MTHIFVINNIAPTLTFYRRPFFAYFLPTALNFVTSRFGSEERRQNNGRPSIAKEGRTFITADTAFLGYPEAKD